MERIELVVKQPTPERQPNLSQPVDDPHEIYLAKRTRHWFGQGVSLTFRETDGVAQGRDRYGYLWPKGAR